MNSVITTKTKGVFSRVSVECGENELKQVFETLASFNTEVTISKFKNSYRARATIIPKVTKAKVLSVLNKILKQES